jgi:bla regulator protein blaR1
MISEFLLNHLWQSTVFAAAAASLMFLFRKNHARVRYALWLAASIKFLIPFSLFIAIGNSVDFGKQSASIAQPAITFVQDISRPFDSTVASDAIPKAERPDRTLLLRNAAYAAWICGCLAVLMIYLAKIPRIRALVRKALPITCGRAFEALQRLEQTIGRRFPITLASSGSLMEPGVIGIFRPVLLLPEGMPERLSDSELEAILAHELAHVRRRDNLFSAVHMFIEALFWFHPMVWWIGAKLVQERERACDEEVLGMGKDPQAYAEGILKVCEFYLESPLACVAGVTGADMKQRIHTIMTRHIGNKLSFAKKLILAGTGIAALVFPLLLGLLNAPQIKAQSQPRPSFDAASIKPYAFDGRVGVNTQPGRFAASGVTMKSLMSMAYDIKNYQITGGPNWMETATYGIEAKAPSQMTRETMLLMLQSLIEERCKLKFRRETREQPVYSLVVAKGGHKLERSKDENGNPLTEVPREGGKGRIIGPGDRAPAGTVFYSGNGFSAGAISMERLAYFLADPLGRKVIDKTGIIGLYDINLQWIPDSGQAGLAQFVRPTEIPSESPKENTAASIFTAIQEQLGLKLEFDKGPVEFFIIESIEKPTEN